MQQYSATGFSTTTIDVEPLQDTAEKIAKVYYDKLMDQSADSIEAASVDDG